MANAELMQYAQQAGNTDPGLISFLQKFIDAGHLTPFEAGQYIEALLQAQQTRLDQQTGQYSQMLAQNDQEIMGRAGDQLQARFMEQGRPRSSGYTAAYLNAARDLALARQPQVAQFYGQGLQGVSQAYNQAGQGSLQRGQELTDEQRQRNWAIEDYYRQQNDANNYLSGQSTRNLQGALLNTGLNLATRGIGAGLGAMGGGGWEGASKGFGLGGWGK